MTLQLSGQALSGQVAIITGAGSGIGRAAALRFAAEGAALVLGDKSEAVHETARLVQAAGGTALAQQMDAGTDADVAALVAAALKAHGRLDVAFANAGISGGMAGIFEQTPEAFAEVRYLAHAKQMQAQYGQACGDAEAQAYYAALKQRFHAETLPAAAKGASAPAAN